MTVKWLKINWLRLALALVVPLVAVILFAPKPVEGA